MIVRNLTAYTAVNTGANRVNGEFGQINMRTGTSTTFIFSFVQTGTSVPVVLSKTRMDLFDLDEGVQGAYRESVAVTNQASSITSPDTEVTESVDSENRVRFSSSTPGSGRDNPGDPFVLTGQQRRRSIAFTFEDITNLTVTFAIGDGPNPHGRNFLFINRASALQPPCLAVSATLQVTSNALPGSFGGECEDRAFTQDVAESGYYEFLTFLPPVSLGTSARIDFLPRSRSPSFTSVTQYLPYVASEEFLLWQPQEPLVLWQDTVWMVPTEESGVTQTPRIGGTIISALPDLQPELDEPGVIVLTLHHGMDSTSTELVYPEATAITTEGGYFQFSQSVAPGMYTVRVRAAESTGYVVVPDVFNVLWNEGTARLHLLLLTGRSLAARETHALLTWDATLNVGLHLNFPLASSAVASRHLQDNEAEELETAFESQAEGASQANEHEVEASPPPSLPALIEGSENEVQQPGSAIPSINADEQEAVPSSQQLQCHVWAGRRECGGVSWARSLADGSEVLTFNEWAAGTAYSLYAVFGERRCSGYEVESSATLPGGGADGYVDCVGNCQTGRGYCYSGGDGRACGNCVLWDPVSEHGEFLCWEFGATPQGGPLPETAEWERQVLCRRRPAV